jgi:23S rRNA (adenine2503-C2)-methyltransferase
VNLIPLNDTAGFGGHAPIQVRMQAFATALRAGGLTATVRRNRGTDIDAACGQLRSRAAVTLAEPSVETTPSAAIGPVGPTAGDASARMTP